MLVAIPPLWLTIEMVPGRSRSTSWSAVAKVPVIGMAALITPTQLGPHSVNPACRHSSTSASWRATPSLPASAKPPAKAIPWRMPAARHSRIASSMAPAETARTASSAGPGRCPGLG